MRRFLSYGPSIVVLATLFVAMWLAPRLVSRMRHESAVAQVALARQAIADDDILARMQTQTRAIADTLEPTVVHIDVAGRGRGAAGSGWVYDELGHIVTNAHVVRGAPRISVLFHDGRLKTAELVGSDPFTDIAVVRVDPEPGVVPARRATGQVVHQGDMVFAFGSPFGFKFSMSQGIVSGVGRAPDTALEFGGYTNFIQTDAAVNPGNSGGPLVDIAGRVIGMNVAIATGSNTEGAIEGQSAGISFAIPLGTIESVVDQLVTTGEIERGFLGIEMAGRLERVTANGQFVGTGVRVQRLEPGSPAERGGLRQNDVITTVSNQKLNDSDVLRALVSVKRPGESLPIEVLRGGEVVALNVVLGELPTRVLIGGPARIRMSRQLGLLDLSSRDNGIEISSIRANSPAARAGLEAGDVIERVDNARVRGSDALFERLYTSGLLSGESVSLRVRDAETGDRRDVLVRLPN
ncbi:MAG: trypsin-like peptidase domain-containing protein [Planctomycetota bacterium]